MTQVKMTVLLHLTRASGRMQLAYLSTAALVSPADEVASPGGTPSRPRR
jgi:hypothetical protein